MKFALVGEENVDAAVADEAKKFVAVAVDAKGVGQAQGDAAPRRVGDLARLS